MKKKPSHVLIAAAAASILVGPLAATSSAGATPRQTSHSAALPGAGKTIIVSSSLNTTFPARQKQWHAALASAFHKLTGANVKFTEWSTSSQELTTLETLTVTHQGPDIFNIGSTFVPTAFGTGAFLKLTNADWAAVGGKSRFFKAALAMSGPSATDQIGVPIDSVPYGILYNKTLFQQAGISSPPHTWTQFVADAEKITNPKKGIYGTVEDPQDPFDPWHYLWLITTQMGGHLVSPNLKTAELNSPKVVAAENFLLDWYTKFHIANPASLGWRSSQDLAAFTSGKVGMWVLQSVSDVPSLKGVPFKWAFAPNPEIPYGDTTLPPGGKATSSFISGQFYAVSKYSRYPSLDFDWIKIYTSKKMQELGQSLFGWQPINYGAALAVAKGNPVYKPFITAENASLPTPFTLAWGDLEVAVAGAVSQMADAIATGHFSPAVVTQQLTKANTVVQAHLVP